MLNSEEIQSALNKALIDTVDTANYHVNAIWGVFYDPGDSTHPVEVVAKITLMPKMRKNPNITHTLENAILVNMLPESDVYQLEKLRMFIIGMLLPYNLEYRT